MSRNITCDRGTFFGYNQLVNDMTCFPIMKSQAILFVSMQHIQFNYQHPWGTFQRSKRIYSSLSKICNRMWNKCTFYGNHDNPEQALSDSNTVLNIKFLEKILFQAKEIHNLNRELKNILGESNVI